MIILTNILFFPNLKKIHRSVIYLYILDTYYEGCNRLNNDLQKMATH